MSLILEALKKSEAQRRLGETPTLATPFGATRRRRSALPWLFLVFVLIAGSSAAWWWLQRAHVAAPASLPAAASRQAHGDEPALTANAPPANAPSAKAQHTAPPRGVANPPVQNAPAQSAPPPQTRPPVAAVAPPVTLPATAPPPAVPAHAVAATNAAAAPARPTQTSNPSPPPQPATPASAPPAAAVASTPVANAPPAAAPIKSEPAVPELNDLPLTLRKEMPALTVTMQMYSADPARRFVVVDGQRKKEGDTVHDVTVHEIRASGVVLEFHGQRFLWPRPGS